MTKLDDLLFMAKATYETEQASIVKRNPLLGNDYTSGRLDVLTELWKAIISDPKGNDYLRRMELVNIDVLKGSNHRLRNENRRLRGENAELKKELEKMIGG